MNRDHLHQGQPVQTAGPPLVEARAAMILLHGRGADAEDILALADELTAPHMSFMAPEAANHTWYPYSFLSPLEDNEPHLSSALNVVDDLLQKLHDAGIPASKIILLGFSQGGCLVSEYAARHARLYGGIAVLSGGLIGPPGTPREYPGSFDGTPVFLGCSDLDPHIPAERVLETERVFARMGASVTRKLYPNIGHTINRDELNAIRKLVSALST